MSYGKVLCMIYGKRFEYHCLEQKFAKIYNYSKQLGLHIVQSSHFFKKTFDTGINVTHLERY